MPCRAAACVLAREAAAWRAFNVCSISVAMRESATALPVHRSPTASGVPGTMVRRKHSMLP
jgi:hypothetical protein